MKKVLFILFLLPPTLLALAGCAGNPTEPPKGGDGAVTPVKAAGHAADAAATQANLEMLSPEDRRLAEEQGFCPVEAKNALGSMGVPVKVTVKDQPVFLCCNGCETRAKAHADRTLARVLQLREKKAGPPAK